MEHDELLSVYTVLRGDIDRLAEAKEDPDGSGYYPDPGSLSPTSRRLLVRSIFAFVEAMTYRLKQDALESDSADLLTLEERAVCADKTYELSEKGSVEARPAKLRTLSNLRFAFDVAARTCSSTFVLDVGGSGYQALQFGLKVRDRLMHPKQLSDLDVIDDEIRTTMKGFHWIHHQFIALLESQSEGLRARGQRLREQVDQIVAGSEPAV